MKILQVIPYLNPKLESNVHVCLTLSRNLVKRGHFGHAGNDRLLPEKSYACILEMLQMGFKSAEAKMHGALLRKTIGDHITTMFKMYYITC